MTKAPVATNSSNPVPITSKAPVQQTRFLHTKAKTKMSAGTKPSTTTSSVANPKAMKQKPAEVLRKILSSDTLSGESSSFAAGQPASAPQTKQPTSHAKTLTFQKPPEEDVAAYDLETVKAIRANNLDQLRQLWCSGKSMDACNQFGESVLHMACRRGYAKMVEFLLCEVKVRSDRCDDFGRNPFHDALWTSTPNFEVVDLLIDFADPALLLSEDVRGNHPFAYARSDHSEKWIEFLEKRKEKLIQRFNKRSGDTVTETATKVEVVG